MDRQYVIGVDLGGTKIGMAICDRQCRIVAEKKTLTEAEKGVNTVLERMIGAIHDLILEAGITKDDVGCIVISSPGPLNVKTGEIIFIASISWRDVPITRIVEDALSIPTYLESDSNAAAYGEKHMGAGRTVAESDNLVYITVSTGIGCGILIDGQIYHGRHDSAGELGHIVVEPDGRSCSCGKRGCLETYASGTAIGALAREQVQIQPDSLILDYAGGDRNSINGETVANAAGAGDPLALQIYRGMGYRLGQGVSIVMQLFDPDLVVIGGGVIHAWDLFYPTMAEEIKAHTYDLIYNDMCIVRAGLGQKAGVIGAALLAIHRLEEKLLSY